MSTPRIVAVGASTGGVQALMMLAASLPSDFPAALLVVQHIGRFRSILPELLGQRGALEAAHAVDGEPIRAGRIVVAPPDRHLLVEDGKLRLLNGPKEHHSRPAIDPLFRSAALAHGPAVVGVVLTGRLDDGTAGLQAIKACGGIAVVQDPADAAEPSMPSSALAYVDVDHRVPLDALGPLLVELVRRPAPPPVAAPAGRLRHEQALTLSQGEAMEHLDAIAGPSPFVCPDCQGGLWEMKDSAPPRYRCHTGHAYTLRTLRHAQAEATDGALWSAVRALQEGEALLQRLAEWHGSEGRRDQALHARERAHELALQASRLRRLVESPNEAD